MLDTRSFLPGLSRKERLAAIEERLVPLRSRLMWMADTLIPADVGLDMPSASDAGVIDRHLADALLARDDLVEGFVAAVARLPEQAPVVPMEALQNLGRSGFDVCCRVVSGAFFLNETVCRRLGYLGQQPIRETPDYDQIMTAIEPVVARGPIYTPVS